MIPANKQVKLLLTCRFGGRNENDAKPFSVNEYAYFAVWLRQQNFKPGDLLDTGEIERALNKWNDPTTHKQAQQAIKLHGLKKTVENITSERIEKLLARGLSLSLALEQWNAAGVWILDREEQEYPPQFKKHLKHQSPAIVFGVGNKQLLRTKAVGFVGSRNVEPTDIKATETYVAQITELGYQVISGGAQGVDETAMLAALASENSAVGVLSGDLLKFSSAGKWRTHLRAGNLALLSINEPEARFTPAAAMVRNKYIYLLSEACIVVRSDEKGGTWSGATENLKRGWVPLLISTHNSPNYRGNSKLLEGLKGQGIQAQRVNFENLSDLLSKNIANASQPARPLNMAEEEPSANSDTEQLGFGFDEG
ncbi:DNA-processing protein DprA [Pseudidiomarina terrestris]|uniref:DNA-processing protein DprA n=1 Tax=Pseudidiomarina terrestris TaxID=2820060 RepID=UPI00265236F1|nr:DNA-processing protein DprA [Pseudidiomarina sp. 1ASP75-5]MDN7135368.1 DNA-protecting protein DprA [Pseudidiomarina sp. 1ASP75-5]